MPSLTYDELRQWLRLAAAPGLSAATLRRLLDVFGSPDALLNAPFNELAAIAGQTAARAALAPPPRDLDARCTQTAKWCVQPGNTLLTFNDPAYPPLLATLHDPPPLLYVIGRVALLQAPAIAIVGSRNATPQGREDAARFARALADTGLTVISGLAVGIEGAAHQGALDGRNSTIAITGTGANLVYPSRHQALAQRIAAQGAVVSEWPLDTPARAAHFPQRNRLIACLTRGVLVIEAALRSGSLITARLANEMGREVFAIPGSIHAPLSRGCHWLIQEGAKLVETPSDILEELNLPARLESDHQYGPPAHDPPPTEEQRVLDALGYAPATLEQLVERSHLTEDALHPLLLRLKLSGHIALLPGGHFVRFGTARTTA